MHQCISAGYVFVTDVPSKFVGPANKYDISSSTSSSVAHKYLQVALAADENVAAKHGNHTADFLLVLANIVSNVLKLWSPFSVCHIILLSIHRYALRHREAGTFFIGLRLGRNLGGESSVEFLQLGVCQTCFAWSRGGSHFSSARKKVSTPRCFR